MGNGETADYLHEIELPDKKGVACNLKQHHIKLLTYVGDMPYYPNYDLGADTCVGSPITEMETLDIKVYLPPAIDFVFVSLNTSIFPMNAGIYMYNLLGQETSPIVEVTKDGLMLDVRDLLEGIYLLQLRDKTGSVLKTEKLVISR
jgi:hypothetical protein